MSEVTPFDDVVLERICDVLGDTGGGLTGSEIGRLLGRLRIEDIGPSTKRHRLFEALRTRQSRDGSGAIVVRFIELVMSPVRYSDNRQSFDGRREWLNEVLGFAGLAVQADGRLRQISATTTLTEVQQRRRRLLDEMHRRNVHAEVLKYCREEALAQDCFDLTFEATKGLMDRIRNLTGLISDGQELISSAFGIGARNQFKQPLVALNGLRDETEHGEQKGLANLMVGLYGTFRNPAGHSPKLRWHVSEDDALDLVTTLSFVHRRLDLAVVQQPG